MEAWCLQVAVGGRRDARRNAWELVLEKPSGVKMAGAIFNGNINATAVSWMMVYMVAFAVAWEAGCNWLSRRCEDNKAHTELLSKIAKELMILGFIAFMVILLKELSVLHWNTETLHVFEFCDLLVSICVLIYVANCWISSMTMSMTQREWDRLSMMPTSMIMANIDDYMAAVKKSAWKKFQHKMPFMATQWRHEADFKVLQQLFSTHFHMPAHFDYVQYINLVLQGVVVSMANLTTLHWVLIMLINAVWWVAIKVGDAAFDAKFTPDDHICLFATVCTDSRRALAATADDGCSNETAEDVVDISSRETLDWMWLFIAVGWFVVLLLWAILHNIDARMKRVLACEGATDDTDVNDLLHRTQQELAAHDGHLSEHELFQTTQKAPEPTELLDEKDNHTEIATKPRRHLIELGSTFEDGDADQVMVFKDKKDSNHVLSIAMFEVIIFSTQFLQLVIDFYLGFYVVHMRQRVSIAVGEESFTSGHVVQQILLHAAMLLPVASSFYVIMLTTRNIALLVGVLHLNENAVSEVLAHMELVKAIRRRIQTVLSSTKIKHAKPDPTVAAELINKAKAGEVAIIKVLSERGQSDRVSGAEIARMISEHAFALTVKEADVTAFMDRSKFRIYQLLDKSQQEVVQTAHTLQVSEGNPPENDTVEVRELVQFILRYVADTLHEALAHSPDDADAQALAHTVVALPCVDTDMMSRVQALTRAKALFQATDKDNSGTVSRTELFQALRKFKVSITKKDYKEVFRVIDPDQTYSMNMDEWIEFMTASEDGLDGRAGARAVAKEQSFHEEHDGKMGSGKVHPAPSDKPPPPAGEPTPRNSPTPAEP